MIELKFNEIERKTRQMSENYAKNFLELDSKVKKLMGFTLKMKKKIDQIDSQIVLMHERVKIQGSNSFYVAKEFKTSFITQLRYLDTDKKEFNKIIKEEYKIFYGLTQNIRTFS